MTRTGYCRVALALCLGFFMGSLGCETKPESPKNPSSPPAAPKMSGPAPGSEDFKKMQREKWEKDNPRPESDAPKSDKNAPKPEPEPGPGKGQDAAKDKKS